METPYIKSKMSFENNVINTPSVRKISNENLEDFRDSLILKNMELVYGVLPAHAIINHVSQHVTKSRAEILSNFESFTKNIIQVYGEVEGRKFLSKLPVTR